MAAGLLAATTAVSPSPAASPAPAPEFLFVQVASEGTFEGDLLTLEGIGPVTVYFSDRPVREVGSITHAEFVDAWTAAADSFASDPPNASLTFREGERSYATVMELMDPTLTDTGITYRVRLLEGGLPPELGPSSLFIDSGGLMQLVAYGAQDVYLDGS
jgi:hypothetical protein